MSMQFKLREWQAIARMAGYNSTMQISMKHCNVFARTQMSSCHGSNGIRSHVTIKLKVLLTFHPGASCLVTNHNAKHVTGHNQ